MTRKQFIKNLILCSYSLSKISRVKELFKSEYDPADWLVGQSNTPVTHEFKEYAFDSSIGIDNLNKEQLKMLNERGFVEIENGDSIIWFSYGRSSFNGNIIL